MARLTFKREPRPGGLAGVCFTPTTQVKMDGNQVGLIIRRTFYSWSIRLTVDKPSTPEDPAPFRWLALKTPHRTEEDARAWLTRHWKPIQDQLKLHPLDTP